MNETLKHAEEKPDSIPEKFWNKETGTVRVEELLKSYLELEKKLGGMIKVPAEDSDEEERTLFYKALGVPETPEEYSIEIKNGQLAEDAEVNSLLHKAGFTPAQVQLVYDLAEKKLVPAIENMAMEYEAEKQLEKVIKHFGSEQKWREVARQLNSWGKKNLPEDILEALSGTYEGVIVLYRMMVSGEPAIGNSEGFSGGAVSEEKLKEMMKDPRYWREKDSSYIQRVTEGFRKLYPAQA